MTEPFLERRGYRQAKALHPAKGHWSDETFRFSH